RRAARRRIEDRTPLPNPLPASRGEGTGALLRGSRSRSGRRRGGGAQRALDGGGGLRVSVGGFFPAEDVVVLAEDPQHRALGGAALGERQVTQEALVAARDLPRE